MLGRRQYIWTCAAAGWPAALGVLAFLALPSLGAAGQLGFGSGQAGQGRICYFGECADDVGPFSGEASASIDAPPPISDSNYANELTDFGMSPRKDLQTHFGLPTPRSIPGAKVVTTAEVVEAQNKRLDFLLVDVWDAPGHLSIPEAHELGYAGQAGTYDDQVQGRLWADLQGLTKGQPDYPIVFFCRGARGWEAYNAALRAIRLGFSNVYWYRGGLDSWEAARLPEGEIAGQ
jgi:PQQ-dependent catabolism-associated CXXCW motif protein